jgi:hypothetical protein
MWLIINIISRYITISEKLIHISNDKKLLYSQILVPKRPDILGKMVTVRVTETKRHCMIAEILDVDSEALAAARCKDPNFKIADDPNARSLSLIYPISALALAIVLRMIWAALSL